MVEFPGLAVALQAVPGAAVDFGEQPGKRLAASIGGLDQNLLLGLGEVVGGQFPLLVQVVAIGGQLVGGGDTIVGRLGNLADLQIEEDQVGGRSAAELPRLLQQRPALGVLSVGGEVEHGERLGFVLGAQQGFVRVQGGAHVRGAQILDGDATLVLSLKVDGLLLADLHVGVQFGVVDAGVQVA